jgi:hypothetical protein
MIDWRQDRVGSALRGQNPTVLVRLPGGFAGMGDPQWLPGYCVLLTEPEAEGSQTCRRQISSHS